MSWLPPPPAPLELEYSFSNYNNSEMDSIISYAQMGEIPPTNNALIHEYPRFRSQAGNRWNQLSNSTRNRIHILDGRYENLMNLIDEMDVDAGFQGLSSRRSRSRSRYGGYLRSRSPSRYGGQSRWERRAKEKMVRHALYENSPHYELFKK